MTKNNIIKIVLGLVIGCVIIYKFADIITHNVYFKPPFVMSEKDVWKTDWQRCLWDLCNAQGYFQLIYIFTIFAEANQNADIINSVGVDVQIYISYKARSIEAACNVIASCVPGGAANVMLSLRHYAIHHPQKELFQVLLELMSKHYDEANNCWHSFPIPEPAYEIIGHTYDLRPLCIVLAVAWILYGAVMQTTFEDRVVSKEEGRKWIVGFIILSITTIILQLNL